MLTRLSVTFILLYAAYGCFYSVRNKYDKSPKISHAFYDTLSRVVNDTAIVAYCYNDFYINKTEWSYHPFLCQRLNFPILLNKELLMVAVTPITESMANRSSFIPANMIKRGPYYRYLKRHPEVSAKYAGQDSFLKAYHIKYLVLDSTMETDPFYISISKKIYTDPISKFSFCVLKQ